MNAYKFILKVTKFQLPIVYRFSTAEGITWLWMDSAPPPPSPDLLGLTTLLRYLCEKQTEPFPKRQTLEGQMQLSHIKNSVSHQYAN